MTSAQPALRQQIPDAAPSPFDSLCAAYEEDLKAYATAAPASAVSIGHRMRERAARLRKEAYRLAAEPIQSRAQLNERLASLSRYLELDCSCESCPGRALLKQIVGADARGAP